MGFIILIPVIIGLIALLIAVGPSIFPIVGIGAGIFVVLRILGWFAQPFMDDGLEILEAMPRRTQVAPIYQYGNRLYQGPVTTAGNLQRQINPQIAAKLKAIPSNTPVTQRQSEYPYGRPEFMVDGTLVGYRYFNRDNDGNLHSATIIGQVHGNWGAGENTADRLPTKHNSSGLYAAYTPESPVLDGYKDCDVEAIVGFKGQVVFDEKKFRAEKGEVVQILKEKPLKKGQKPLKFYKKGSK
jgi:hypothetical protein